MRFDHKLYEKLFPAEEVTVKPTIETMVETVVPEQREEEKTDGNGSSNEPDSKL